MTDVVTPDFKRKIQSGAIINNPCIRVKTSIYPGGGGYYEARLKADASKYSIVSGGGSLTSYRRAHDAGAPGALPFPSVGTVDSVQLAQAKALASVDKAPYSVAEDIATIRQTIGFLRRPFASINAIVSRFDRAKRGLSTVYKRGRRLKSREALIADLWLEYRFALMPLTRTTVNIINSLNRPGRNTNAIQSSHGTAEFVAPSSVSDAVFSGIRYLRTAEAKQTVRATVLYKVIPPTREWQYKYGLRFKDIPELMWDLFPMSFMYDRILDVGTGLRGLTNFVDPSVKIVGGCVSKKLIQKQSISCLSQTHASYNVTIQPDVDRSEIDTYTRTVWIPSILNVLPPVMPGGLTKDISSIADLTSLILQKLK